MCSISEKSLTVKLVKIYQICVGLNMMLVPKKEEEEEAEAKRAKTQKKTKQKKYNIKREIQFNNISILYRSDPII